jgi:uncharacterized iron-regulated membrane protein
MSISTNHQEAVMGRPVSAQHPSVVLRSHFKLVRGLLAIAMVAVVALAAVVVILANDDDQVTTANKAAPAVQSQPQTQPGTRYDGGPDEGTRGLSAQSLPQTQPGTRYDGGPEEGTRDLNVQSQAAPATTRFDGGPEEGTRGPQPSTDASAYRSSYQPAPADGFKDRAGGPRMIPNGPGSR